MKNNKNKSLSKNRRQDLGQDGGRASKPIWVTVETSGLVLNFWRNDAQPWPLAAVMPLIESCGLYALTEENEPVLLKNNKIQGWRQRIVCRDDGFLPERLSYLEDVLGLYLDLFATGLGEVDSLNRLALGAGLGGFEIGVWRAWVAYAQQLNKHLASWSLRRVVRARMDLAKLLWELWVARLHPTANDSGQAAKLEQKLRREIGLISLAEHERAWQAFLSVVLATVRTNCWQREEHEALAFKVESGKVVGMPGPKPWREIFVYHPLVEGVHLRGGPVARGGLRHSNREGDYRTEVLGLMLTQMRKNSIIVPLGAKGGFLLRRTPQQATADEVTAGYKLFVRALLSVTDTYDTKGRVVGPRDVRRLDGDDPYLVVAADKGTARFSDTANALALAADFWPNVRGGFWLGDAFASGGSQGYDHKAMGITARGGWISVEHHLATLGIVPGADAPLRMVGIGDMGGDVFGNGLLLCPHVQLVAAFNHSHIFIDPNPNCAVSLSERKRLFAAGAAGKGGWEHYDAKKISAGGGVWRRDVKEIELSMAARELLGLSGARATPDEIVQAMLRLKVDVLWNGGIGTYIAGEHEADVVVADKANDAVRVRADTVRVRVIGEGGNLGITPRGRVELALRGVQLNTDAVDNSAGVSASDHEVNIKILLRLLEREGKLSAAARAKLLRGMTDSVAALVLRDNHLQNMALSLVAGEDGEYHSELLPWQAFLVAQGWLDPLVDSLPNAKDLTARNMGRVGGIYTRPELCSLLAGTKLWLRAELLRDRGLLECAAVQPLLEDYFPPELAKHAKLMQRHPLAREIIATVLANMLVNRLGILAVRRLCEDFDVSAQSATRACVVAYGIARLMPLWEELDGVDLRKVLMATRLRVLRRLQVVGTFLAGWILRHGEGVDVDRWLKRLHGPCSEIFTLLPQLLAKRVEMTEWVREWKGLGLSGAMAGQLAVLSPFVVAPDAVLLREASKQPLARVLTLHLQVGEALRLPALVGKVRAMPVPDTWARQAVQAMVQELFLRQRRLTERLLRKNSDVQSWLVVCGEACKRYHHLVDSLLAEPVLTVAMLSVVLGRLRELEG